MNRKSTLMLTLYIAGRTPAAAAAIDDMRQYCLDPLQGRYEIEVVDVNERPQVAHDDRLLVQVLATPALIGVLPSRLRRILIDDLIMREQVLLGINLQPEEEALQPTGNFA